MSWSAPGPNANSQHLSNITDLRRGITALLLLLTAYPFPLCGVTKYTLTTKVSPSGAGTVSGGGSYTAGARVQVNAVPAPGYYFSYFGGSLGGSPNPQILFVNSNSTVTAYFLKVSRTPSLIASTGSRTPGPAGGQLTISFRLTDTISYGTASKAKITSITGIRTIAGTGNVSVATAFPVSIGDLSSGQTGSANLTFNWPSTVSEVQLTVNFSANLNAYKGSTTLNVLYTSQIQHIIFFIKENRSFDDYFGKFPGAAGATTGVTSTGSIVPLIPDPDMEATDLCHTEPCALTAMNNGLMNQFDLMPGQAAPSPPELRPFVQFSQNGIPNYWAYASFYTLADHMFSSMWGPSFPNHLYTIAAQGGGVISNPSTTGTTPLWGCDSPSNIQVQVLSPNLQTITNAYPCFDFPTLGDQIDTAHLTVPSLTWKYYSPPSGDSGYAWNAYNAINHIRYGPDWSMNIVAESQFISDAMSGNLASVNWVVTSTGTSDHPPNSVCAGENDTVAKINAVMQGPQWGSTAIFVTWDDFGGYYDHLPPPQIYTYGLGIRVPLIIVSPYALPGHISSTIYSFESLLAFAENVFGLPPLLSTDTLANNMADSFNFAQTPLPPLILQQRSCPVITVSCPSGSGQAGVAYTSTVGVSGGMPPYRFYAFPYTAGSPPPGLAINSATGAFTGTPTTAGTYGYSVEAADATDTAGAAYCNATIAAAPPITLACPANMGQVGAAYSSALAAGGGVPPYTFSITAGQLPAGLTLNSSTGAITGTPAAAGSFSFTAKVTDSTNTVTSINCGITIAPAPLTLACPGNMGQVGTAYSSALAGGGGVPPYTFSITAGQLPAGLTLNSSTGAITGTPAAAGSFSFTAKVTDSTNTGTSINCGITIAPAPLTLACPGNMGQAGTAYSSALAAGGGVPPYTFSITAGQLPPGLTLNSSTGAITGRPAAAGSFSFTAKVTDSTNTTASINCGMTIAAAPLTLACPGNMGQVGTAYSSALAGGGGVPPYTFSITTGQLPAGLNLNSSTGAISGTPIAAGSFSFTAVVGDSSNSTATVNCGISIAAAPPVQTSTSLAVAPSAATLGQAVTLTAQVSPAPGAGKITFYDGVTVLEQLPVSSGSTSVSTVMLATGMHALRAAYDGAAGYTSSVSAPVPASVQAAGSSTFAAAVPYSATGAGTALAAADFNGDGKADLIVADGGISVFLGNGDGTFQAPVNSAAGTNPIALTPGDFNGDGLLDVAALLGGGVAILLGNGDGTFQAPVNYPAGSNPAAVAMADFNGDGIADLAVTNASGVSVLLGNGDGSFAAPVNYAAGNGPSGVAAGDFNGDGRADMAIVNSGDGTVSVLLGNGDGTFQTAVSYRVGSNPQSVAVGDVNTDGLADLVVGDAGDGTVTVLLGNGDGTFQAASAYPAGVGSQPGIALGDVNGDGHADVVAANPATGNLSVLLGKGDGTFQAPVSFAAGNGAVSAVEANFHGGGAADVAVAVGGGSTVAVLLAAQASTSLTLTSSANPANAGDTIMFTATLAPAAAYFGVPTGTVTFSDNGVVLPNGSVAVNSGAAVYTTNSLAAGTHEITATYSGDVAFQASTAPVLTQTIQ